MEVTREVLLEAPLEEVWDALTDPEQIDRWFSEDGESRDLAIEVVDPRRGVAYTWEDGRVVIEVEESREGTRIFVTESGEPGWNAVFALHALARAYA